MLALFFLGAFGLKYSNCSFNYFISNDCVLLNEPCKWRQDRSEVLCLTFMMHLYRKDVSCRLSLQVECTWMSCNAVRRPISTAALLKRDHFVRSSAASSHTACHIQLPDYLDFLMFSQDIYIHNIYKYGCHGLPPPLSLLFTHTSADEKSLALSQIAT